MNRCRFILFSALVCSALSGCSVKSDRSNCPSLLYLSVWGGEQSDCELSVQGAGMDKQLHLFRNKAADRFGIELNRNEEYLLALSSGAGLRQAENLELGEEMPELYSYSRIVSCDSDVRELDVELHKEFCRLYFHLQGVDCRLRVRGNVCGFDVFHSRLVLGLFCHESHPLISSSEEGNYQYMVRIPRQIDDSLMLEFLGNEDGEVFQSFKLGKLLMEMGVDWTKPDLDDLHVSIDYFNSELVVSVQTWQKIEL